MPLASLAGMGSGKSVRLYGAWTMKMAPLGHLWAQAPQPLQRSLMRRSPESSTARAPKLQADKHGLSTQSWHTWGRSSRPRRSLARTTRE